MVTVAIVDDEQVPFDAVIVNVTDIAAFVLFKNIPEIGEPVPLAAIPVIPTGVVRVQLKVVPAILFGLLITISANGNPEQTD
jgi:hypothetical protein